MDDRNDILRAVALAAGAGLVMTGHVFIGVALIVFVVFADD